MQTRKRGFSLAEALITLLIVCLITLASIPILTKKKRNLAASEHGTYICTLNSNNDYVEFNSKSDTVNKNNPDEWRVVGNTSYQDTITYIGEDGLPKTKVRNRCKFKPPSGARNFNVTVVGGGGGGHDASVEYIEHLKSYSSGSYVANSNISDYYDLILVSGGGGGGGSPRDWNNGSAGWGGGGGAGGVVKIAGMKLTKGASYAYNIGWGGATNAGEMHGCCKPNNTGHPRAGNGGASSFNGNANGSNINIYIPGAEGGDSVGCSKKKCRGGGAGYGVSSDSITVEGATGSVAKSSGPSGTGGSQYCNKYSSGWDACGVITTAPGGKNIIESFELNTNNNLPYVLSDGSGGDGKGHGWETTYGTNGFGGVIIISQSKRLFGEGGKAGNIESRFVPSIEGYIVASIPAAVEPNTKGGTVVAELYKNKTNNGILKQVTGGDAGGTNLNSATDGDNSLWTYKGGGKKINACSSVSEMPGQYVTVKNKKFVCDSVKCELLAYDGEFLKLNNKKNAVAEFPAGAKGWDDQDETNFSSEYFDTLPLNASVSALTNYLTLLKIYYITANNANGKIVSVIDGLTDDLEPYYNKSDYDNKGCYFDKDILEYHRVCADTTDHYKEVSEKVWKDARQEQTCAAAGNGVSFGAGGGGGIPGDLQGVFGKGGKGAPGAIIIEW